jgi:glycine cleavage system H protein
MAEYLETTVDKFTFKVPLDRLYTSGHTWLKEAERSRHGEDGLVRIGVTDYLQQTSGDVAFADVTAPGTHVAIGDTLAALETIKVNLELPSPLAGLIKEANAALQETPELVNQDPYGHGWLAVLAPDDWPAQRAGLLEPQTYFEQMKAEAVEESKKL